MYIETRNCIHIVAVVRPVTFFLDSGISIYVHGQNARPCPEPVIEADFQTIPREERSKSSVP